MKSENRANTQRARMLAWAITEGLTRKGWTQGELAERVGISASMITEYVAGRKYPRTRTLRRIVEALEIDPASVGLQTAPDSPGSIITMPEEDVVLIPRNGLASAGAGAVNTQPSHEYDPYPRDELYRLTGINPNAFRSSQVIGDSMQPEIPPGTRVIYIPTEQLLDAGIYIFALDEITMVKMLQPHLGGAIEVIPLNEQYSRETLLPLPDADTPNTYRSKETNLTGVLRIIGKVLLYPKTA